MKLGELAHVDRGISTGNRKLFVMTRADAKARGLERFVRPVLNSAREFPREGRAVVHDGPARDVVLLASSRDVEEHSALREYLGNVVPRVAIARSAPIVATYTGVPRFVENPDGLVITNSLYRVTPRQPMSAQEIRELVERLNAAMSRRPPARFAERWTPRQLESIEV